MFKELLFKIGADKIINHLFKTNDTARHRIHKDGDNLLQVIYQIISAYFEDDCADELTNESVMTAILNKDAMASQLTLSRFYNRMDADTLEQLVQINHELRKIVVYTIKTLELMLFDIDTTLFDTYGKQEGRGFITIRQMITIRSSATMASQGNLLKAEFREGAKYCSNGAGKWNHPRWVVFKIEKPYGQMAHMYTFIVTTIELTPYQMIQFYCGRGKMENYIKEGKAELILTP